MATFGKKNKVLAGLAKKARSKGPKNCKCRRQRRVDTKVSNFLLSLLSMCGKGRWDQKYPVFFQVLAAIAGGSEWLPKD